MVILLGLMLSHLSVVVAEEPVPNTQGILDATGTTFMLTDSEYLNLSVTSSAEIDLYLMSIPTNTAHTAHSVAIYQLNLLEILLKCKQC